MSESVSIVIMGQTFNLQGSHDPEYVARVENFLNARIDAAKKAGGAVDSSQLMMLVALNLVDDCFNKERELKQLHEKIEERSNNLIEFIDANM